MSPEGEIKAKRREEEMNTATMTRTTEQKPLWHVTVDLAYYGSPEESCQDGVRRIRKALDPILHNRSGVKDMYIVKLPARE
jgi:hypothetical protein